MEVSLTQMEFKNIFNELCPFSRDQVLFIHVFRSSYVFGRKEVKMYYLLCELPNGTMAIVEVVEEVLAFMLKNDWEWENAVLLQM